MSKSSDQNHKRKLGYRLTALYVVVVVGLILHAIGVGVAGVIVCSILATLITYMIVNPPSRYRRHGLGQIKQAVDHRLEIFGKNYAEDPVESDQTETARNSPCPCGSGKKYKRCCGRPGAASD